MNHTIEKHFEAGPTRFIRIDHRIPKAGVEVVGYNRKWIAKRNPRGTRICFIHPETKLWVSAVWSGFEYYTEHGINPTHWKSTGKLPDEDIDGNAIPNPDWNDPEQDHHTTYEDVKYLLPSMDDLPGDVIEELKWLASVFPGAHDQLFSWDDEDNEDCPALADWVLEQFGLMKFFIDMREFLQDEDDDSTTQIDETEWPDGYELVRIKDGYETRHAVYKDGIDTGLGSFDDEVEACTQAWIHFNENSTLNKLPDGSPSPSYRVKAVSAAGEEHEAIIQEWWNDGEQVCTLEESINDYFYSAFDKMSFKVLSVKEIVNHG